MKKMSLFPLCFIMLSCHAQIKHPLNLCKYTPGATTVIKGGEARMESDFGFPEERTQEGTIRDFDIDTYEVTNADFREFIESTGYLTTAEKPQPGANKPGGAVFKSPTALNPSWWHFVEGANWRNPEGPGSSIVKREKHPVVQVSLVDALTYAKWAGRALPTEIEWEYAARAGSKTTYI